MRNIAFSKYLKSFSLYSLFFFCLLDSKNGITAPLTQVPLIGIIGMLAFVIYILVLAGEWPSLMLPLVILGEWASIALQAVNKFTSLNYTSILVVTLLYDSLFICILILVLFTLKKRLPSYNH